MELFSSINKNLLVILFMILPFSVYSTTYIKNIRIDADDNAEPGDDDTTFWFSGTARYDLESDQDSVDIHIYFEYVPFGVGRAFNHELERGYNHFICIDSLSSGDIGMVAPGDNHEIKWRFKTRNGDNQCRIKIGRLNGLYTPISSYNSSHGAHARMITNKEYSYNNMGLKSENKITYNSNRDSGFTSTSVDIPLYTKYGQLIKSDESSDKPEKLKRYNDRHLVVFDREGWGATLHYVFGAVYDSERRIIERYSLSPDHVDFTEEDRETFYPPDYILEYDDQDRYVLRKQYKGGLSCKDCPDYNFAGYEAYRRYFSSPDRKIPDSTVISCVDTNEDDQKHRSIITNETITINGEVKHDSTHEYNMYTGSPGTCCRRLPARR